jgi:hypothetical protein
MTERTEAGPSSGTRISDYDYELPDDRIARYPAERRDESRLLVLPPGDAPFEHLRFKDVAELLRPGDLLVVNESRVRPARLLGRQSESITCSMRRRVGSSGSRPRQAPMFSRMWSGFDVAGIAQVTAGCETMYFRKNWLQAVQSNSDAHSGRGRPCTRGKRFPPANGRATMTPIPRSRALGRIRSAASRSARL